MEIKLSELLKIYKPDELDSFLKLKCGKDLNERNIIYDDIKKDWSYVGENEYNASTIDMLSNPGKGLIERITNGIDAVLEKEKIKNDIKKAEEANDIVKVAFPRYYENKCNILNGTSERQNAVETDNKVVVAVNDSTRSSRPTIDVVDKGCGIKGDRFIDTILSIHKGNKSKTDKNYLIGAFGQGGSTSLPYSYATIIISKYENKYYFTIVKSCTFEDLKMKTYLFFTPDGSVSEIENDNVQYDSQYINEFIKSESGTLIRMIDMDIPREYRANDVSKPGMLGDFINTELYNVAIPVKVIENRADYKGNEHAQNRNSFGSFFKMLTWKYAKKDMFGKIEIEHNNRAYNINYYVILPDNKEEWAKDSICKNIFNQINVHQRPIIYTVNGQYISDESFTRLKNVGLSFLQYRLLIEINLDVLGKEKYDFFTTDRSKIKESDLTKGFLDKVISAIANEKTIKDLNEEIGEMSVSSNIDEELLSDISKNVKGYYNKYLKAGTILSLGHGNKINPQDEEEFYDTIQQFDITTTKNKYCKNEAINIVVTTGAKKSINEKQRISVFVDGREYINYSKTLMNGRIQFNLSNIKPGEHSVQFDLIGDNNQIIRQTSSFDFEVINEDRKISESSQTQKQLDLDIKVVDDKELIADISIDENTKAVQVQLCLSHDLLADKVYGRSTSNDEIQRIKNELIEPLALFMLFTREDYDKIETIEKKNDLIIAFCTTYHIASISKN